MTRFDAKTLGDRRSLVSDAIDAHRKRDSVFCTVEADSPPPEYTTPDRSASETGDELLTNEYADGESGKTDDEPDAPAWVQFSDPESQLNLDCTDEEYDRITDVLATVGAFTVDEQTAPENAAGRNLRITARADADRIAQVVDRIFVEGFGYDEDFRLWATEI